MPLTTKDYKKLLEIIEVAYSFLDRPEMIRTIFEKLQGVVPFSSAVFIPLDPRTADFQVQGHVAFHTSSKPVLLFARYFAPLNPMVISKVHVQKINTAARITDYISPARLQDTEYGRDFQPLTPLFYEMGISLGSQGDPVGVMGLHRKKQDRDFTKCEMEILTLLAPHLSRAIRRQDLLEPMAASDGIGVITMGADGKLLSMNQEAARALNGRPVGALPDPGLGTAPALFRSETGVYRIRTAFTGTDQEKKIFLKPLPITEGLKSKLAHYALSRRQEEVALFVIRGLSNREIAEQLFICEQTVKDHLQDIFEKCQVHRRSALIARVMGTTS